MVDVRCPMCGKTNPEELDTCQFCQAALRPMQVYASAEETPASPDNPPSVEGTDTGWLRSFFSEFGGEELDGDMPAEAQPDEEDGQLPALEESAGNESNLTAETPAAEETSTGFDDLDDEPEWLHRIREHRRLEQEAEASRQNSGSEPDPSAAVETGEPAGSPELPEELFQALEAGADELGWLSPAAVRAGDETPAEEEPPAGDSDQPADEEDLPEWLANFQQESSQEAAEFGLLEGEFTLDGEAAPASEDGTEPDWGIEGSILADSFTVSEEEPVAEQQGDPAGSGVPEVLSDAEMPAWLREAIALPDDAAGGGAQVFEPKGEASRSIPAGEEGTAASSLEEADRLPVERQPAEAEATWEQPPVSRETSGPLAGLLGVLPAEPEISQVSRPGGYTSKLLVSELQQAQSELFESLIKSENETRPLRLAPVVTSQSVLRWAIALVMIAAILWSLALNPVAMAVPAFPPETGAASQLINGLQPGAPVLVAVDYEPGWSGEMDAAAAPVLDHLMLKGAHLAMVSTSPVGPLQAERLVDELGKLQGHAYQAGVNFTNFGFIPGGAVGLTGFARSPREILPQAAGEGAGWESEALKGVQSLADFNLVLVITENADTARAWIEQVQPALSRAPLIMVTSAQAEPLVLPYYLGNPSQVQGIVAGMLGGAAYENLNGRTGLASGYWSTFSLGLLLAAGLMIVGGIASTAMAAWSKAGEANQKGEAAA